MATSNTPPAPASDQNNLPPAPPAPPAVDPEVARLRAEVSQQRQTLDQMRQRFTAPPAPATNNQPMTQAEMNREFFREPITSTAAIAQRVIQDTIRNEMGGDRATLMQVARDTVRSRDPQTFDKYALEIEQAVNLAAPQFQTNINVWDNAFKLVKGAHIDEILAARGQQAPPQSDENRAPAVHISREGGPGTPSNRQAASPKGEELSQEEKRVAKKLGLSEDAYKQGKKDYADQVDVIRDPVGPSSWDQYITFSSRDKRRAERAARKAKKTA